MRSFLLALLAAQVILVSPVLAQSRDERCATLRARHDALKKILEPLSSDLSFYAQGKLLADDVQAALQENRVLTLLMTNEDYSTARMRAFRQKYHLPADLELPIGAGRPDEFWRRAQSELLQRWEGIREKYVATQEYVELNRIWNEMSQLGCFETAPRADVGASAVPRRPDGQPLITDDLINRWLRALYALAHTGGSAHWQAGRMTQQDYLDVHQRINLYRYHNDTAGRQDIFTSDEIAALNGRRSDIDNAIRGYWSQVTIP